jgi:hypothetical protein
MNLREYFSVYQKSEIENNRTVCYTLHFNVIYHILHCSVPLNSCLGNMHITDCMRLSSTLNRSHIKISISILNFIPFAASARSSRQNS